MTEDKEEQPHASEGQPAAALRQSEEHFLHLVAGVTDYAIFLLDPQGRVVTWNAGAERLKGWKAEEIIGQYFSRFYPQEALERDWPAEELRRAFAQGRLEDEGWRVRKDGSTFWANVVITALKDDAGHLRGFLKITRDLTDRRRAEEALRQSEERFRLMVEAVQDYAIFMLDPQGHVVTWNTGAERLKGYRPEEIVGRHFSVFYPKEAIEQGWPEHELRVATQEGRFEDEGWRVRKDGSRFWANVVITALKDGAGVLRGFSKVTRDMTQRKQAEEDARRLAAEQAARQTAEAFAEALRAQQEHLRITLESIGDAVIASDPQAHVTMLNPVAQALTGWSPEEAVGQPLERIFQIRNEVTGQPAENPVARVIREGVLVGLENHTVLVSQDGSERAIEDCAAPIRDKGGNLRGCVMVFHDVTAKRRAEQTLRQQTERLQEQARVLDLAQILIRDIDGQIHDWNAGMAQLYGFTAAEAIGQTSHTLLHTEFPQPLDEVNAALLREGRWQGELMHRRKDGGRVVVASLWALHRGEDGEAMRVLEVNNDITRQKEAEQRLRESEEQFRAIFEFTAVGMVQADPASGRLLRVNARYCDITGYSADELRRMTVHEITHPDDRAQDAERFRRMAVGESRLYESEKRYVRKDGSTVWVHTKARLAPQRAGQPPRTIGVIQDITARREAEVALRESKEQLQRYADDLERRVEQRTAQLQEINAELEAFSYSISHDLRAPLRAMLGIAKALLEDYGPRLDTVAKDYARRLIDSARRMDGLIQDLLGYSRLSRLDIHKEQVSLGSVVGEVVAGLQEEIKQRQAEVTVEEPFPLVMAHRSTVVQMVTNLLTNALKFVPPGQRPRVRIRGEERDRWGRLWVEDNGIGIAVEHQQRIFNVFERLHGNEAYPGTGIGLAVVKKGVERLGGRCGVESLEGNGSRFWIELPLGEGRPS